MSDEKLIRKEVGISKEQEAAVKEIAAEQSILVADVYRDIVKHGLRDFQEGIVTEWATQLLDDTQNTGKRIKVNLSIMLGLIQETEETRNAIFDLLIAISKDETPDIPEIKKEAKKNATNIYNKYVEKVKKGQDKVSKHIRNELPDDDDDEAKS